VTINELRRQRGDENDPCYKAGAVAKAVATIKASIAQSEGSKA
jgi:hypothetical protein